MNRFRHPNAGSDWVGLGEASQLLGVTPGTLRRWSDAGRIGAFTTPGGHRRYRRAMLQRLVPTERAARPSLSGSGFTAGRLTRAYRAEARIAARVMPWVSGLNQEQREWFRTHGRQLGESLILHLDARDGEIARDSLRQAAQQAAGYGRMAAGLGVSLSQTVEGFLQFRRPFLHQLGLFAGRRGLDVAATTELIEVAERAMDRLLMSAMTGHGVHRAAGRLRSDVDGGSGVGSGSDAGADFGAEG